MSTNRAPVESGLQDIRTEWVAETTPGEFPADPSWNAFAAEIAEFTYSTDGNKEGRDALGNLDTVAHDRAAESASATLSYRQARFPVDSGGAVVDPVAYPITTDASEDYPSHTVVERRDVAGGGKLNAGYREFAVLTGARPVSASFDGDPSATEPIPQELGYEAERGRTHIVHQPDTSQTLVVKSTDSGDTNDVIIESADADTTETVTLPGSDPNEVTTSESFGDIDAIEVVGEHAGDIQVGTDTGSGSIDTELLETPLTGTATDGVDSIAGIPALGSGSHASDITADGPQFLGTDATWVGSTLADRVHTLNMTVEREVSREPRQTTRRQSIDVGARSVSIDADVAGPYETAERIAEHHRDKSGDIVWTFDTGETITANSAELVDAPEFTRSAGDTNYIPSVTFEPKGDPAIEINNA
jgi:hypothetical protein